MKPLTILGLILLAFSFGTAFGRFYKPRVVTEIKEVVKDRVVTIETGKTVIVRTRVTTKPDGTVIKETTDTHKEKTATGTMTHEGARATLTTPVDTRWSVAAMAGVNTSLTPTFGGHLQYRLLGPVSVGVWGLAGPVAPPVGGISLGVTF